MDKIGKDEEKGMSENKQYEDDYVALDLTIYQDRLSKSTSLSSHLKNIKQPA